MPSTSTRSHSISSNSTTSSKSSNDGIKKKFCCTFPACGKSFSRSEHLHRHALNHKDGNNTCLRCSAHFRRRDLLDRHMARHKEKDDEAGGEGLGVLATRKRLWRDADGNIVNARRPSYTQEGTKRRQITRTDRKSSRTAIKEENMTPGQLVIPASLPSPINMSRSGSASSTIIVDTGADTYHQKREEQECSKFEEQMRDPQDSWLDMNIHSLPSPPVSEASLHSGGQSSSDEMCELDALYEDTWSPLTNDGLHQMPSSGSGSETPSLTSSSESSPYFGSASWGSSAPAQTEAQPFQTFMGAMAELPYDDIFKPEAGLYEWQTWNSQVLMSRCREEKYNPLEERKLEWGAPYPGQESFRKAFGLGTV